jgi:hypothetical protein
VKTALARHSLSLYEALLQSSEQEDVGGMQLDVYRGSLVNTFKTLGIGMGYYSSAMRNLEDQGCVTKLQQGAKGVDTVIVLHHPPDEDAPKKSSRQPLTPPPDFANLSQRVEDIQKSLGGLNIVEALADIQRQVTELSERIPAKPKPKGKADKA